MVKKLVILDFDGTIYKGDSLLHFVRFLNPAKYYGSLFIIAFPYVLSRLGLLSMNQVKELFFRMHLKGFSEDELQERGIRFFKKYHLNLFPKAIETILKEQEDGARCMVVSASCRNGCNLFVISFNWNSSAQRWNTIPQEKAQVIYKAKT